MTDIDFDELDKAVNSLMGGVAGAPEAGPDKQTTLSINSTLKEDEKPAYGKLGDAAEKIGDEIIGSDDEQKVVELIPDLPADVKPPEVTANTVVVQPIVEPPAVRAEEPVLPAPSITVPDRPAQAVQSPAVKRPDTARFMDMVHPSADMRVPASPVVVRPAALPLASQVPKPEPISPKPSLVAPGELPQSPFLPDTKVEKRPLGGEAPTGGTSLVDLAKSAYESQSKDPAETEIINNDERIVDNGDGDEQRTLDASDFDVEAATQERKLQSIEAAEATGPVVESIRAVESGDTEKIVEGMSGHDDHHQELAHPAKQKSGWGVVIVIIVIIVLAALSAGAAYFIFAKP